MLLGNLEMQWRAVAQLGPGRFTHSVQPTGQKLLLIGELGICAEKRPFKP